jgi:hypothetical protein
MLDVEETGSGATNNRPGLVHVLGPDRVRLMRSPLLDRRSLRAKTAFGFHAGNRVPHPLSDPACAGVSRQGCCALSSCCFLGAGLVAAALPENRVTRPQSNQ